MKWKVVILFFFYEECCGFLVWVVIFIIYFLLLFFLKCFKEGYKWNVIFIFYVKGFIKMVNILLKIGGKCFEFEFDV